MGIPAQLNNPVLADSDWRINHCTIWLKKAGHCSSGRLHIFSSESTRIELPDIPAFFIVMISGFTGR